MGVPDEQAKESRGRLGFLFPPTSRRLQVANKTPGSERPTLTLPKKPVLADPLADIVADTSPVDSRPSTELNDEVVAEYLRSKGFTVAPAVAPGLSDPTGLGLTDPTEHIPTAPRNPFDLSTLPPPGERNCAPVSVPAKTWGNPRLLVPSAPPGPQPLFVPPKGR